MDDMTGGRPAPKPQKRPNRLVRFLAFLVTLALMVGAVALVANYDKLNFDFIKRWFSYRTLARNDSGQAESFHFVGDSSNCLLYTSSMTAPTTPPFGSGGAILWFSAVWRWPPLPWDLSLIHI